MTSRAQRLRNLLGLIAFFASIVVAGCWDNRRTLQHVLDEGYPTIVQITGAQFTRFAPIALDGWRPRFLEQNAAVDLKWEGKDGKPHEFKKVPVSEDFAATIITGEQVRLAILPAKALDDPQAVPVINADAATRYASLQDWIKLSGYVAAVGWIGCAGFTFWLMRRTALPSAVATPPSAIVAAFPPRRTLLGFTALLVGAILTFHAWSVEGPVTGDGIETTAEITTAATVSGAGGGTHVVQVAWKDTRGAVHHYGPIRVSEAFWSKITRGGALAVHETRIRYRGEDIEARPVLIEDRPDRSWATEFGLASGLGLMAFGAVCVISAARSARRSVAAGTNVKKARQPPEK